MRMRRVYINKGFRVSTTQHSMWDKKSGKQRVGNKNSRVRTISDCSDTVSYFGHRFFVRTRIELIQNDLEI